MSELVADQSATKPLAAAVHEWLTPAQLLTLLKRNWALILICGIAFAAVAYVCTSTLIAKRYTAAGNIVLETRSLAIPELQGALTGELTPDMMPLVRSEVQVLYSRPLVLGVVQDLHLTENPEFNATLRPPTVRERVSAWVHDVVLDSITRWSMRVGLLAPPPSEAGSPSEDKAQSAMLDGVVGAVQHDLAATNDNRSLIIDVQFTAESPELAAAVVNRLIARYMAEQANVHSIANREANVELEQRIAQVRDELQQIEQKIRETRQKYNLVQLRAGSVGQQRVEDLASALTKASADRAQVEAKYEKAAALARTGGVGSDSSDLLSSGTISVLRDREATAERRVAQLATTLGPNHPVRNAAEAELASARAALAAEAKRAMAALGTEAAAVRQREADLKAQLADAQNSASGLIAAQGELQQLEKDADAHRTLYQTLLQRAEQTQSDKASPQQSGARVVSFAVPPLAPSSPRPKLAAAVGLLSGCAFGGLLSAAFRRNPRGYDGADELAAETGVSILAVLPRLAGRTSLAARVLAQPSGPEAEALRSLRTRLRFNARGAMPRNVLFVSSLPGEGNTSIAAAFARVAAIDGLRTLLIEGDLQSPEIARLLDVPPNNGLVEALEGREHWMEVVARDPLSSLDLLLVERPYPAASQLLETMQLQNLLAEAREEYNLVVMDAQPVSRATNSLTLAHLADAVVLVVEARATARGAVRSAIETVTAASRRPPVVALSKAA